MNVRSILAGLMMIGSTAGAAPLSLAEAETVDAVDFSPLVRVVDGQLVARRGLRLIRDGSALRVEATSLLGAERLRDFVAANADGADTDISGVGVMCNCGGDSGKCAPGGQEGSDGVVCVSNNCTGDCSMDIILTPREPKGEEVQLGDVRLVLRQACQPGGA